MLPADLCSSTGSSPQYFTTQIHVRYLCSAFSTDANPLFRVFSVSAVCHLGDIDCSLKLTSCMQNIKPVFVRQHWQAVRRQPNPESWPDEYQHDCLQGIQSDISTVRDRMSYPHAILMLHRTTFAISYGLSFAAITSTIVHTWIYYRKQIIYQSKRSLKEMPDIHARLMSVYEEVPNYWYGLIFSTSGFFLEPLRAFLSRYHSLYVRLWRRGNRGLAD